MHFGKFGLSATPSSLLAVVILVSLRCFAAGTAELRGVVLDPQGAAVSHAEVKLLCRNAAPAQTRTDDFGSFVFQLLKPGRCRVRAASSGFATQESEAVYIGKDGRSQVVLSLKLGVVAQQLVVSANGIPVPISHTGATISSVDRADLSQKLHIFDALREAAGVQALQTAQRGGTTDLFVRGGNPDANKVLLDGIPVNDIGGRVEFANLGASGIDLVEVLRGPNSVLYGADALASVVNLTTAQGTTRLPQLVYSIEGGNFSTKRQEISLGGAQNQLDYFGDFSRFDTENSEPNSAFHNGTYAGNVGWSPSSATQLRFTLRHTATALGLPGALDLAGLADDSFQKEQDSYFGVAVQNQTTNRWVNLLRYGGARLRFQFDNPSPTGEPFDPFGVGVNFLGNTVTLRGANGFRASGRAILDFGGAYPQTFDSKSSRDFVYSQSEYRFDRRFSGLVAFRYEKEQGFTGFADNKTATDRNAFDYTLQLDGSMWERLYASAGIGVEKNAVFGIEATPRISVAYYMARIRSSGFFNGTKLRFNFGKGIKEPAIFNESTSLFVLLSQLANGSELISQFHVKPIGAERSRSFDFGVDEIAWNGRAKLGLTLFHNEFSDQVEFVDSGVLPQLGVPLAVAAATPFGASVNSGAFQTMGGENELQLDLGHGFKARASYTYLDGAVQRSFVNSALAPAFNPAFPTVPIGNSPLIGSRPFRRATHSGSFQVGYSHSRISLTINGTVVGKRDDSTHAIDPFFGNTLLLPNRNLDAAYQAVELDGSFRVNSVIEVYTNLENLLSQHYDAAFGFPSLPFTFRTGMKLTLGGESWKTH